MLLPHPLSRSKKFVVSFFSPLHGFATYQSNTLMTWDVEIALDRLRRLLLGSCFDFCSQKRKQKRNTAITLIVAPPLYVAPP